MVKVQWKIGKKPKGNWLTPLYFNISIIDSQYIDLNVHFVFKKEYPLPDKIYCTIYEGKRGYEHAACKKLDKLAYNFDKYISKPYDLYHVESLNYTACSSSCTSSSKCRIFLPWRPGTPDYSDFIEVFQQVAHDFCEAWNCAVAEAMASEEFDMKQVTVTSDNYISHIRKEITPSTQQTIRKLKL